MAYTATIMCYRICFVDSTNDFYTNFELVMNIVFGIDILISFFSAYYDADNNVITNQRKIMVTYIKGWFLIDVVSV